MRSNEGDRKSIWASNIGIGLREDLQETMDFPMKLIGVSEVSGFIFPEKKPSLTTLGRMKMASFGVRPSLLNSPKRIALERA